jgi:hypothetical protein
MSEGNLDINYVILKPKIRKWPLVPEEFGPIVRDAFQHDNYRLRPYCAFVPDLNPAMQYENMSSNRQAVLTKRAEILSTNAVENLSEKVSEDRWEEDINASVFLAVRRDNRLRVQKRVYEYISPTHEEGASGIKSRIPDQTLGLATYQDSSFDRHWCTKYKEWKRNPRPHSLDEVFHASLRKSRLSKLIHDGRSGLVVDGKWGEVDLIFPWGVYEAKKAGQKYEQAKKQVFHAAQIYLGMLDDLARNPEDVSEAQSEDKHQIFLFTSCASEFSIWIAYKSSDRCMVDNIWNGDLCVEQDAYELLCIMDQIENYAVTQHREFVVKHLEPWFQKIERNEPGDAQQPGQCQGSPGWVAAKDREKSARKEERAHRMDLKRKAVEEECLRAPKLSRIDCSSDSEATVVD